MKSSNLVLRLSFPTPEEREESLQEMRRRERPRHEVEKALCSFPLQYRSPLRQFRKQRLDCLLHHSFAYGLKKHNS